MQLTVIRDIVATSIRCITVPDAYAYGICGLLADALETDDLPDTDTRHAVAACLADGFTHFSGSLMFPIAHPTYSAETGFIHSDSFKKWSPDQEYGRRRLAALKHIQDRAEQFTVIDNTMEYTPCS